MYRIARPINGISLNGNEYVLDDDNEIKLFESRQLALDFLGMSEADLEDSDIDIQEIEEESSEYPYCMSVAKVLAERTYNDPDEFGGLLPMCLAAYDNTQGCINDAFWDLEELDRSIVRKFRYALIGILREMGLGEFDTDYEIIVEPCTEDRTEYAVIRHKDNFVMLREGDKAWHFGHEGGTLEDLEEEFSCIASSIKTHASREVIPIKDWLLDGNECFEDICVSSHDVLMAGNRMLDKAGAQDIVGEICFRGDDGKFYVGLVEYTIAEASPELVSRILDRLQKEDKDFAAKCERELAERDLDEEMAQFSEEEEAREMEQERKDNE